MTLARRSVLAVASLAAAPRAAWAQNLGAGVFSHGVASGDPLPDGVVIWTRCVGARSVAWEVARDESFRDVAQRGQASVSPADDFCVKVDVRGLASGARYFYRFLCASGPSETGLTRTAPRNGDEPLILALVACSNFAFGYFHAYRHAAARDDVDLVLHVGDYMYELPRGAYPSESEAVAGRIVDPAGETLTLPDYCQRYAAYHSDPDLRELRRRKPICVIWDDHEIADNTWRDGALGHSLAHEGAWADRVAAAMKAYFDWMPIRRSAGARGYRGFDWGDVARIMLLDTRLAGRSQQLDARRSLAPRLGAGDNAAALRDFRAMLNDPSRSMLGAAQEAWLTSELSASKQRGQTWQIVAQQVVTGEQIAPEALLSFLPPETSAATRRWFEAGARLSTLGLPWNLDSWNGYPAARARLLESCAENASNAVILSGDSHNCWLNNLSAPDGALLAGVEFAAGSVTSPGFERRLSHAAAGERERVMRGANANLAWCDVTNRGYGVLRFTRTSCEAEWLAFSDVRSSALIEPVATRFATTPSRAAGPEAWNA